MKAKSPGRKRDDKRLIGGNLNKFLDVPQSALADALRASGRTKPLKYRQLPPPKGGGLQ